MKKRKLKVKKPRKEIVYSNNKIISFMQHEFSKFTPGMMLTIIGLVATLVTIIIYKVAFSGISWIKYYHFSVTLCMGLGIGLASVALIFKRSARFAPFILLGLDFLAFLLFFRFAYLYFSEIFYSGFTIQLFFQMYYGYLVMIFVLLITFIILVVACFMKQTQVKDMEEKTDER